MSKKTKRLYFKLIILVLCLCIIIRIFTLVLSKYESVGTGNADVDVAYYLFKEDFSTMTLNLDSYFPTDDEIYTYTFSIGNQDGENIAEIDLTYDLTIRTTTNLHLTYELYMNEEYTDAGASSIIQSNTIAQDDDGTYFRTMTTDTEELLFRTPKTNVYQLVVYFPSNYNTEDYQDIIEAIEITVESRQFTV